MFQHSCRRRFQIIIISIPRSDNRASLVLGIASTRVSRALFLRRRDIAPSRRLRRLLSSSSSSFWCCWHYWMLFSIRIKEKSDVFLGVSDLSAMMPVRLAPVSFVAQAVDGPSPHQTRRTVFRQPLGLKPYFFFCRSNSTHG